MTDFTREDGDAYWLRNREALTLERAATDPVLRLLDIEMHVLPVVNRILEVGCANGWRLAAIKQRYPAIQCFGVELSPQAIEASRGFPGITVNPGTLGTGEVHATHDFDVAVVAFVFHWLNPADRLQAFKNLDGQLAPGGMLCLMDFLPKNPHAVPYHHRDGVFTYKANYGWIARAVLGWPIIAERMFDHDAVEVWNEDVPEERRCAVQLLRKPTP